MIAIMCDGCGVTLSDRELASGYVCGSCEMWLPSCSHVSWELA